MTDIRTTSLLTEHLGYLPILVIDDVINSVNEIMYKCTQAVEDYLVQREEVIISEVKSKNDLKDDDDVVMEGDEQLKIPPDEIELGTAKLETLLESAVDKNFDLFELYSLRNILTIPDELVKDGWFRLEHHKDLLVISKQESLKMDDELVRLRSEINTQLALKKILNLQQVKVGKIHTVLQDYYKSMNSIIESSNSAKIEPMRENLHFVISELKILFNDIVNLKKLIIDDDGLIKDFQFKMQNNGREEYINKKTDKLLLSLGLSEE